MCASVKCLQMSGSPLRIELGSSGCKFKMEKKQTFKTSRALKMHISQKDQTMTGICVNATEETHMETVGLFS